MTDGTLSPEYQLGTIEMLTQVVAELCVRSGDIDGILTRAGLRLDHAMDGAPVAFQCGVRETAGQIREAAMGLQAQVEGADQPDPDFYD